MFFHELSDSCRTPSVFCELDLFAVSLTTLTPVRLVKETWSVNSQNRATTRGRRPSPCEPRVPRRTCFLCEFVRLYLCELFATESISHDSH